jgi:hypothetical protein
MSAIFYRAPDRLQSLLLAKPTKRKPLDPHRVVVVVSALCGLAVLVMHFSGWLPGAGS